MKGECKMLDLMLEDNKKVKILDTEYTIVFTTAEKDKILSDFAGYCDYTVKRIVIDCDSKQSNLHDFDRYVKQCLRHEIVHAFLFESGLAYNSNRDYPWAVNEEMVDWIAFQGEKIYKAWQEAGAV